MIPDGDQRCYLGNGISCGLGSQSGGAGNTGIYLDYRIFKAGGMQGKLTVTATFYFQSGNDIQGGSSQHLVFFVRKGNCGSHNNTVTSMYTNRVKVFHGTDGNCIACTVTNYFKLNFLPAGNTFFHKNLVNRGAVQSVLTNFPQFLFVGSNTTTSSTKGKGGTNNNRIANLSSKIQGRVQICYNLRRNTRLTNGLHGILEHLAVFCSVNSFRTSTQQPHSMLSQKAFFSQLHRKGQACLATQGRKQAIGLFLFNNSLKGVYVQWLNVDGICHVAVSHQGSRIGVYQNNL